MKISDLRYLLLILLLFPAISAFSQGYLMLAGGGAESSGGWSDAPYRWVVEHAANKRIAVVGYDAGASEWIPNYFKGFGAKAAKNIIISSRSGADMQSLYDTLITYDGVFIKGGDQGQYYSYYKGTKTQAALQFIYDKGGVLSGTSAGTAILSPVVYTAVIASVDPATALQNAYSAQITLADDFVNTLPKKYIVDTHFHERGRFGRLPAFMATWFRKTKEIVIGIGVDDHTALCIDADGKASVYGTGAVGFYHNMNAAAPYDTTISMLRAGNMNFSQLIHGCTIDLKTGFISGLGNTVQPRVDGENKRLTLLMSGTDYPSEEAYNYFIHQAGAKDDAILIVTGSDLSRAADAKLRLQEKGATSIYTIQALTSFQSDDSTRMRIGKAKKFLVIANDYNAFTGFIHATGNGSLLLQRLKQSGVIAFFAGDNARFAGRTVIHKYTGSGSTSYHGTLEFLPGLGLLKTTAVMPNAFISADTYENTVSGLPYAMVADSLKYGLYLSGNTFAAYSCTIDNKSYFKNISGSSPLIFLQNNGTPAGFANHGPYNTSRNIAGFGSMDLKFLGVADTVVVGRDIQLSTGNLKRLKINIYPNPAKDLFHIQGYGGNYMLQIVDMTGKIIFANKFVNNADVMLESFPGGMYLLDVSDLKTNARFATKLCVEK